MKTVSPKGDVGSNPTPSAIKIKMYYVYILKSQRDGNSYIDYTTDLRKRFQEHQDGKVESTKPRRPMELIFYEAYKNMGDARRRERYFKTSGGKSSLRMMLRDSLK